MQEAAITGWAHVSAQLSLGTEIGLEFICGIFGGLWVSGEGAAWSKASVLSTGAAVQEVSQPSLEFLNCVRLRWRHLLLKTNEDINQKRPTKHCCKEENLSRNTLLSLPETKM